MTRVKKILLIGLAILFIVSCIIPTLIYLFWDEIGILQAAGQCERWIKEQSNAPLNAKYPLFPTMRVKQMDTNVWYVQSYFSTEKSLGETIRVDYYCTARYAFDGWWRIDVAWREWRTPEEIERDLLEKQYNFYLIKLSIGPYSL